jgi:hypothetical protein
VNDSRERESAEVAQRMMQIFGSYTKYGVFRPKIAKKPLRIGVFVATLRPLVRKDK